MTGQREYFKGLRKVVKFIYIFCLNIIFSVPLCMCSYVFMLKIWIAYSRSFSPKYSRFGELEHFLIRHIFWRSGSDVESFILLIIRSITFFASKKTYSDSYLTCSSIVFPFTISLVKILRGTRQLPPVRITLKILSLIISWYAV